MMGLKRKLVANGLVFSLLASLVLLASYQQAAKAAASPETAGYVPPLVLSTFEDGVDGWGPGENVAGLTTVSSFLNGPFKPRKGMYSLDATFVPGLNANEWRSVIKSFDRPLDLTNRPYIVWDFDSWGTSWLGGQENYVRIKVYSGEHAADSGELLYAPDQWNAMSFDLNGWEYRKAVDKIEILYRTSLDMVDPRLDPYHMQIDQVMATADPGVTDYAQPDYIAGYSFDLTSGAVIFDDSGYARDAVHMIGSEPAPPSLTQGKVARSIVFDGSDDEYLQLPGGITDKLGSQYTFAVWVNPEQLQAGQSVFHFESADGSSLSLSMGDDGKTVYSLHRSDGTESSIASPALTVGKWNLVAVAVSGQTGILYVNGEEAGRNDQFSLQPGELGEMAAGTIGKRFKGAVDEFRMYDRALTAREIADMDRFSLRYKFDERSGTTVADASKFMNHAEVVGTAAFGTGSKGKALIFNGIDNFVKLAQGITDSLGGHYTISSGIKLETNGSGRLFEFADSGTNRMYLEWNGTGGGIRFAIEANGRTQAVEAPGARLPLNEWAHLALSVDGSAGVLYLNGIEIGRTDQLSLRPSDLGITTDNVIGKSDAARGSAYLKGRVDEFRIDGYAADAAEIKELSAWFLAPERSPQIPVTNGNWTATDALGRKMPAYEEVGPTREGKYVGVFYYIWHGHHGTDLYDNTKILAENPANPQWGPVYAFHYWGEPEAGYYRADDPWVIRRNLQMLSDAGVDFIYFDATNAFTYLDTVDQLCRISLEMRQEGIQTPYIVFTTSSNTGKTMTELYDQFYSKNKYRELWFIWDGKPLILGNKTDPALSDEAKNFFTFRYSWAWTDAKNQPDHWQWIDDYPQDYGWHSDPKEPEQVAVAVASHPTRNIGQSYSNGTQPAYDGATRLTPFTGQGLHFTEQWQRALKVDPDVVMVTQWNEWMAQRFTVTSDNVGMAFLGKPLPLGETYFVDAFNEEYNRDIEPMKGGHTDNNYYLLMSYIRQFKGMTPPEPANGRKHMKIDGDFADWAQVQPVFRDPQGDTAHRNWPGYDPNTTYSNTTGRNDIVESRVAYDGANAYFYVKTAQDLTPHTDANWMQLYIDADQSKATGWEGYDYAVNLRVVSDKKTTLSKYEDGRWKEIAQADYRYAGNQLEIAVSRRLICQIGRDGQALTLQFHWADNVQKLNDITEFFLNGDSAPDRRANYRIGTEPAAR